MWQHFLGWNSSYCFRVLLHLTPTGNKLHQKRGNTGKTGKGEQLITRCKSRENHTWCLGLLLCSPQKLIKTRKCSIIKYLKREKNTKWMKILSYFFLDNVFPIQLIRFLRLFLLLLYMLTYKQFKKKKNLPTGYALRPIWALIWRVNYIWNIKITIIITA